MPCYTPSSQGGTGRLTPKYPGPLPWKLGEGGVGGGVRRFPGATHLRLSLFISPWWLFANFFGATLVFLGSVDLLRHF